MGKPKDSWEIAKSYIEKREYIDLDDSFSSEDDGEYQQSHSSDSSESISSEDYDSESDWNPEYGYLSNPEENEEADRAWEDFWGGNDEERQELDCAEVEKLGRRVDVGRHIFENAMKDEWPPNPSNFPPPPVPATQVPETQRPTQIPAPTAPIDVPQSAVVVVPETVSTPPLASTDLKQITTETQTQTPPITPAHFSLGNPLKRRREDDSPPTPHDQVRSVTPAHIDFITPPQETVADERSAKRRRADAGWSDVAKTVGKYTAAGVVGGIATFVGLVWRAQNGGM